VISPVYSERTPNLPTPPLRKIHRWQCGHRLNWPYNTYSHITHCTVSGTSCSAMCNLNILTVVQSTQLSGREFHLSTTLLLKVYFLTSSLHLFLNNFLEWPLLPPLSNSKKFSFHTLYISLTILKVSIKSLLTLRSLKRINPNLSNRLS